MLRFGFPRMSKISVLIPDGESTLTKHVVHCLAYFENVEIHILSKDPRASIRNSRFVKSFHAYDAERIGTVSFPSDNKVNAYLNEIVTFHHYDLAKGDALVSEISDRATRVKADIIFPVDEHIVKILAARKDDLRRSALLAPLPSVETFVTAIDKWQLASNLKGSDVPHPATVRYSKGGSEEAIRQLQFPVIIKPIDQGNALGIRTFDTPEALLTFFEDQSLQHQYIVQPLIDGYDIDCSCLCQDGKILAYTIQRGILSGKNRFAAAVGIEFLQDDRVLKVTEKLMKRLNWSGVAHMDLRYDRQADEIKVIEINARYWGSLLGSLNAGVNFPELAIRTARGESFPVPSYTHNRYFMGRSPMKKLWTSRFGPSEERVHLRDTSLFFTLRDPMPAVAEFLAARFRR